MADDPTPLRARLRFLRAQGFADVEHDSHVPFLAHLVGTRRLLERWGARPALCDGGLFHSVYGTEYFHPPELRVPPRSEVQAVIGPEAEAIAWSWCTLVRDSIDPDANTARDRDGAVVDLDPAHVADLATLWAADTVEQIARMTPDERAFAHGLPRLLARAMPAAREGVEAVRSLVDARVVGP